MLDELLPVWAGPAKKVVVRSGPKGVVGEVRGEERRGEDWVLLTFVPNLDLDLELELVLDLDLDQTF